VLFFPEAKDPLHQLTDDEYMEIQDRSGLVWCNVWLDYLERLELVK